MFEQSELLLEAKHVTRRFPTPGGRELVACNDVNLKMYRGRTLGLVGESGCGKSTFMRFLVWLDTPSEGEIIFHGKDITKLTKAEKKEFCHRVQMIFQNPYASLNPRMTVKEIVGEGLKLQGKSNSEIEAKVEELLRTVGLNKDHMSRFPHEFSGGQRQRIGIARALSVDPEFIVCDEPISALDVSIQAQVLNLLKDLQREYKLTYMFVTHDMSVVRHISDHICVMYLGQAVEKCESKRLFKKPLHPYTQALLSVIPSIDLDRKKRRILLKGELVSPVDPPPGCRFAPRCPHTTEACQQPQQLEELLPDHYVACCRARELNKDVLC